MNIIKNKLNPTTLSIVTNLISFVITFGISFYVTPYVTKNVGMEAYGLVGLANNFTNYITIATAALNTMASRFIIIQIHKSNIDEANTYFNSTLFANFVMALISLVIGIVLIFRLDYILKISPNLVTDAKITFFIVFFSFSLSLIFSVFNVGYYALNKLYVGARRTILSDIIRIIMLICIFNFIGVKIQYTVIATTLTSLLTSLLAVSFTKKNLPKIIISKKYIKFKSILEMIKGGIWNSISKLSQVLLNGLDLFITNIFIGGSILGTVSIAKTFSSLIITVIGSVSDVFLPKFLKAYADGEESLKNEFYKSTKILSFFSCLVISLFISYCAEFYQLWLPGEDWYLLWILTCVSLISIAISGPIYSMFSIYTVVNKVKPQALSTLIMSVLSTMTVFILLKFTNLGVYAIVCTSTIYGVIKNMTYNMYCLKKYINLDIKKCYFIVFRNVLTMSIIIFSSFWFKDIVAINSYFTLFENGIIGTCFAILIYFIIGMSIEDKKSVIRTVLKRVRRVKNNEN